MKPFLKGLRHIVKLLLDIVLIISIIISIVNVLTHW